MKAGEDDWKRGASAYPIPYLGSKRRLVRWIMESIPQDAKTVFDAFSGSGVVAYALKKAGFRVIANDRLRYCHHISRAIIENDTVRLTDDEIDALIADNPRAATFVQDHFDGVFFEPGVHRLIDMIRANVDRFSGYKRDIALAALGRACTTGKKGFPLFHSTPAHTPGDTPERFRARVAETARCLNAMVIDTGARCEAHRADIMDILPRVKADLVYFDPPYATEFQSHNYERDNHFVEGLMTYWDGLKIRMNTTGRYYEMDHTTVTKTNCYAFFFVSPLAINTYPALADLIQGSSVPPRARDHEHGGGPRDDGDLQGHAVHVHHLGETRRKQQSERDTRHVRSRG